MCVLEVTFSTFDESRNCFGLANKGIIIIGSHLQKLTLVVLPNCGHFFQLQIQLAFQFQTSQIYLFSLLALERFSAIMVQHKE